ncbi:MAG: GNAT family N-acetyltransferase [Pseudomonadota bacterium]
MPSLKLERVHGPARREIVKGLRAFNTGVVGKSDYKPLTVTVKDKGAIVGGVVGETYFGWMFVSLLWVSDKYRGKKLGRSLMESAEKEARKRGVRHVYLDTFSFQAPGFYKKLGYREFGRLKQFPAGHDRVWMSKAL